jgi:hypothetical protein
MIHVLDGRFEDLIVEIFSQHPTVIFDTPHENVLFPCGIYPISSLKFVSNNEYLKVKQTALREMLPKNHKLKEYLRRCRP